MLNCKCIQFSKVNNEKRFDSKFYFLEDELKKYKKDSRFNLIGLGDKKLLKKITDGEHAGQKFVQNGVLFIKNSSIKDFEISLFDGFYIEQEKHIKLSRSALKAKDILFTTIGHLGSSTIVPEDFGDANINQNLVKMEINEIFLNPYYLAAYLNSSLIRKQIACLFTGNIHGILTYPKIKKLQIIKPKKELQEEIERLYKKSISLERKANEIIMDSKKRLRDGLNIDFDNIPEPKFYSVKLNELDKGETWIPKFYYPKYVMTKEKIMKKWKIKKLSTKDGVAEISKGSEVGSDNYNHYLDKNMTDYPFIRTSDIYNFQVDLNPDYYIPSEIGTPLKQKFKENSILFTKDGKIGFSSMVTHSDKVIVSSGVSIINATKINPNYLFLTLLLEEVGQFQSIQGTVYASTIPHLREQRLKCFEIPLVDKGLYNKLCSDVEMAFKLKEEKKKLMIEMRDKIDKLMLKN